MPITTTLRAVLDAAPALDRLAAEKLPIRIAYHVAKLVKLVRVELADFHEQRRALVQAYGVARPATDAERPLHGPEVIEVPPEKLAAFHAELEALVAEPVTIDRPPLQIADAVQTISPADLVALGPLVIDDGDV